MELHKPYEYKEVFTDWVDRADFAEMVYRVETSLFNSAQFNEAKRSMERGDGIEWVDYHFNKARDALWEATCNTKAVMQELQSRIDQRDADIQKLAEENTQLRALLDASGGN